MTDSTTNQYAALIARLDACSPLITGSRHLAADEQLRQDLLAQSLAYGLTLTDLSNGTVSENDAGIAEMLQSIPAFCALIESELRAEPAAK